MHCLPLAVLLASVLLLSPARADGPSATELPDAKPVPDVQVLPLPHDQASFRMLDHELTRYHFGADGRRPFWYPLTGPGGRSLTRMGHPHDPITHSHHNSVWISHNDVGGVSFWADHGPAAGRIVHQSVDRFEDGDRTASMVTSNAWLTADGKPLLFDRRRAEVEVLGKDEWRLAIDLELRPAGPAAVVLGDTPFGILGVRMAKTIGVSDGGGRILNSDGKLGEAEIFRKPARWVDYSGPVTGSLRGGITLFDHPQNINHPAPFHVRVDGWMGACLTHGKAITVVPGQPLRLRYGLWMHPGVPAVADAQRRWQQFAKTECAGFDARPGSK